jgi:hypothetical protein
LFLYFLDGLFGNVNGAFMEHDEAEKSYYRIRQKNGFGSEKCFFLDLAILSRLCNLSCLDVTLDLLIVRRVICKIQTKSFDISYVLAMYFNHPTIRQLSLSVEKKVGELFFASNI